VLLAALRLADAEGLEALSMRNLAQKLGVKAMSLYNHAKNKDDLIDGIVDIAVGKIEVADFKLDWKTAM
jgi:AcrR family transcriptional regulator